MNTGGEGHNVLTVWKFLHDYPSGTVAIVSYYAARCQFSDMAIRASVEESLAMF